VPQWQQHNFSRFLYKKVIIMRELNSNRTELKPMKLSGTEIGPIREEGVKNSASAVQ
jgi:hypothetical protein